MSLNLNAYSHFAKTPHVDIERSKFSKPFNHKTTFNAGDLVPFYAENCLPASTYELNTSAVIRMATPVFPVMDNAYCDFYYFFVPYRLLWEHWREFNGENRDGYWTQPTTYLVPRVSPGNTGGWPEGSLADHFGFPTKVNSLTDGVSCFPFRAYTLVWNEWFRNENTDNPSLFINTDEDLVYSAQNDSPLYGGKLLQVCREHDYFSDCLPQPQKMEPVTIPIAGNAPVVTGAVRDVDPSEFERSMSFYSNTTSGNSGLHGLTINFPSASAGRTGFLTYGVRDSGASNVGGLWPNNLYADLSGVTAATINDLRMAFATQRYAERLAYGGSRYTEQLNTFYGLTTQDSRLQRPEFLGSSRVPIGMQQVTQTSSTDDTSPQGNVAAYSLTVCGREAPITYSTQEHGIILGLMCVRHSRTYQQGLSREWSKRELFDFYNPTFAHLGNMAVLNKEIYFTDSDSANDVFGYEEAWSEYRYKPSIVSGLFRSNAEMSLDSWHYADYYERQPYLSEDWMKEGRSEIQRTIAVPSQPDFLADINVSCMVTAPMPLYSVPGLIDHF